MNFELDLWKNPELWLGLLAVIVINIKAVN
jgi:hypothetical protein